MVSAALNVKSNATSIHSYVCVQTACSPRVQLSIGVDGVGLGHEVFVDVEATEVTQSPRVVRGEAE